MRVAQARAGRLSSPGDTAKRSLTGWGGNRRGKQESKAQPLWALGRLVGSRVVAELIEITMATSSPVEPEGPWRCQVGSELISISCSHPI